MDDEPDVHLITKLALRRKSWRGRGFELAGAASADEARRLLSGHPPEFFQLAFVDVVMEADDAGLKLCEHIRNACARSLRLVLRTGQPGAAPKDSVLAHYDIDHYLAKTDASEERIFTLVRACLRASVDVSLLLSLQHQLQGALTRLRDGKGLNELVEHFGDGLAHLGQSHNALLVLCTNLETAQLNKGALWTPAESDKRDRWIAALEAARRDSKALMRFETNPQWGLEEREFVMVVPVLTPEDANGRVVALEDAGAPSVGARIRSLFTGSRARELRASVYAGFVAVLESEPSETRVQSLQGDLLPFVESWKMAYATLSLREDILQARAAAQVAAVIGQSPS